MLIFVVVTSCCYVQHQAVGKDFESIGHYHNIPEEKLGQHVTYRPIYLVDKLRAVLAKVFLFDFIIYYLSMYLYSDYTWQYISSKTDMLGIGLFLSLINSGLKYLYQNLLHYLCIYLHSNYCCKMRRNPHIFYIFQDQLTEILKCSRAPTSETG